MLGTIIGDVIGSIYEVLEVEYLKKYHKNRPYEERIKILDKNTPLFTEESSYTDDTVLTCAILDAIKNNDFDYKKCLKEYGLKEINLGKDKYGRSRFGKGFIEWLNDEAPGLSYGNGAAMRVSPVGFLFNDYHAVMMESLKSTIPTHNNVEAITSSQVVALSIYLLKSGKSKDKVIEFIKENYYDLEFDLEDLQRNYKFSSRASESVPEALYVFSVSNSFEDAIRKAISIGGDSDTIAAIVGGLAEACYGIPEELKDGVKPYLNDDILKLLSSYYGEKVWKK